METSENSFVKNYNKDVSAFLERKQGKRGNGKIDLVYLKYADCIRLFKQEYGNNGEIEVLTSTTKTEDGNIEIPYFKCKKANYAYVRTRVIIHNTPIGDMIQEEILPVMNEAQVCIPLDKITTADVDDTIARCKVKNIAIATGIGLCLYCGGKEKDHIDEVHLTDIDEALYKDNMFMFMYKSDPLKLRSAEKQGRQVKEILGNKYIDWGNMILAIKTLFPYSTFGNKFTYTQKGENEEVLNYIPRERGEIATSHWIKVVYPVHEKDNIVYKEITVNGERRVLDTTRLKTVNLNTPGYTRTDRYGNTKQVSVDFGFQINTGNKRCFCKTVAENLGLYLTYYQKEQENETQETTENTIYTQYITQKAMQNKQTKQPQQRPNFAAKPTNVAIPQQDVDNSTRGNVALPQKAEPTKTNIQEVNTQEVNTQKNVMINEEYEEVIGRNYPFVDEQKVDEYNYINRILHQKGHHPQSFEEIATANAINPVELTNEHIDKILDRTATGVLKLKINYFMEDKKLYSSNSQTRRGFGLFDNRMKSIAKEAGIPNLTEDYFKTNVEQPQQVATITRQEI